MTPTIKGKTELFLHRVQVVEKLSSIWITQLVLPAFPNLHLDLPATICTELLTKTICTPQLLSQIELSWNAPLAFRNKNLFLFARRAFSIIEVMCVMFRTKYIYKPERKRAINIFQTTGSPSRRRWHSAGCLTTTPAWVATQNPGIPITYPRKT